MRPQSFHKFCGQYLIDMYSSECMEAQRSRARVRGDLPSCAMSCWQVPFAVRFVQSCFLVVHASPSLFIATVLYLAVFSSLLRKLLPVWPYKGPCYGTGFHSNRRSSRVPSFALGPLLWSLVPLCSSHAPHLSSPRSGRHQFAQNFHAQSSN